MTYQDSSGRDVPLGVLTTYDYLIKPMKKMLLQIKDHREGTKYVNKQKYSESKYDQIITDHYWKLWGYNDALIEQYDRSIQLLNSNTADEINQIKHISKLMVDAVKLVTENYLDVFIINPPQQFLSTHTLFLNVFETIFSPWEHYIRQFEKIINDPPKDDETIDLIADFRGIHNSLMTWKNNYESSLAHETSNNSYDALDGVVDVVDTASSLMSGCFIVSAVYGSPFAAEINPFRKFRDKKLITNPVGNVLVQLYYEKGPFLALIVLRSYFMRRALQCILIEPILRHLRSQGYE